jgi:hypothetical protein
MEKEMSWFQWQKLAYVVIVAALASLATSARADPVGPMTACFDAAEPQISHRSFEEWWTGLMARCRPQIDGYVAACGDNRANCEQKLSETAVDIWTIVQTSWYVWDASHNRCVPTAALARTMPNFTSPSLMAAAMERSGEYGQPKTEVARDVTGHLISVTVKTSKMVFPFFVEMNACRQWIKQWAKPGRAYH